MNRVEVSPIEPGINPKNASHIDIGLPIILVNSKFPEDVAICPRGVAPEKPSTTFPAPSPKMESCAMKTLSPDIFDGYAKKRNALVDNATLKMFIPVPPKTSLTKITEKAVATAIIQIGVSTGQIIGIRIPDTRKPS